MKTLFTFLLLSILPCALALAHSLSQTLQKAQYFLNTAKDYHTASSYFDTALLQLDGKQLRSDLPRTNKLYPVYVSAGRSHYELATHEDLHLHRAIIYFQAALDLDSGRKQFDSLPTAHALITIFTQLGELNKAELVHAQYHALTLFRATNDTNDTSVLTNRGSQYSERLYDHALWIVKHRENTTSDFLRALTLLEQAAAELKRTQTPSDALHSGLSKPFYIWGLILSEWGKLLVQQDGNSRRAHKMYADSGQELWSDPLRRFVTPINHQTFMSTPGRIHMGHPLYPLSAIQQLQANFAVIQDEVLTLARVNNTTTNAMKYGIESESLHSTGRWSMLRFTLGDGMLNSTTCDLLPLTCSVVSQMPSLQECISTGCSEIFVYVSKLSPGTNIPPHCGPTQKRLRIHLPLKVPRDLNGKGECCWLELARSEKKEVWKEGEVLVFDDSFEHSVTWGDGAEDRIVLIVDVWHPTWKQQRKSLQSEL